MNRVECLPFLLIANGLREAVAKGLEMEGVLFVFGVIALYVFYKVVRYVHNKKRHFQNYVDMMYFLKATSKIDADRCQKCSKEMPRSRRRHHSRSRSRSRSSHDRDRDAKRRKVESYDSPHHRRSVRISYQMHYDLTHPQERVLAPLQELSRLRIDTREPNMPVLYVAMATWMPKCNMYHRRDSSCNSEPEDRTDITTTTTTSPPHNYMATEDGCIENINDTTNENVNQTAIETVDETVNKTVDETANETADETAYETFDETAETADETANDTVDEIAEIFDETANEILDEIANETMNETANETTNETANETMNETTNETTNETADDSVIEIADESPQKQPSGSDVSMATADEKDSAETPKRVHSKLSRENTRKLTPKQIERRREAEKKHQERLEEKERKKEEANKLKQLKDQQKQKEKQEKLKEKEKILKEKEEKKKEKELKKKEKEEKGELKRKEKELEKLEKQQKIDEKNKEKQRIEEAKLKAAAAFTKFFKKLPDQENEKSEVVIDKEKAAFMPFEIKSDMVLAPITRKEISVENKNSLEELVANQIIENLYLNELKNGKEIGRCGKTWPKQEESEDVVIIGDTIEEQKHKIRKMRVKLFQFCENQRPAYYGTFRKKSKYIGPRRPFGKDEDVLEYEIESDEEWQEEPEGESLKGTDDEEEKENEGNDDYEVDNDFFVPHGHLSEDEVDDEAEQRLNPEMHKAKLKLLKNEFEQERRFKTQKIRPVIIGTYWQGKTKDPISEMSIANYLTPHSFLGANEQINITERSNLTMIGTAGKRKAKFLSSEYLPLFLKFIHGSSKKGKELIKKFIENLEGQGIEVDVSQMAMGKQLRKYAVWTNREEGVKKRCWIVREEYQKKFNLDLASKPEVCKTDTP